MSQARPVASCSAAWQGATSLCFIQLCWKWVLSLSTLTFYLRISLDYIFRDIKQKEKGCSSRTVFLLWQIFVTTNDISKTKWVLFFKLLIFSDFPISAISTYLLQPLQYVCSFCVVPLYIELCFCFSFLNGCEIPLSEMILGFKVACTRQDR